MVEAILRLLKRMNAPRKTRRSATPSARADELSLSGRMDFESFKSLFVRALDAAGPDTDHLEMFCHEARIPMVDWMTQELRRRHPARGLTLRRTSGGLCRTTYGKMRREDGEMRLTPSP